MVTKTLCDCFAIGGYRFRAIHGLAENCSCENAMRLCREWGATNVDTSLAWTASGGYESTICLCYDWGTQEIDLAMTYAAKEGPESVVRLCRDLGTTDIEQTMLGPQAMVTNL